MISVTERAIISHSKPTLSRDDENAVNEALRSGYIADGPGVERFEREVSQYLGFPGAIATSTGTSALFAAIAALGAGAGDEVVLPTYVCRSVLNAVVAAGAAPVLCDVEDDWCASRDTIAPRLTRRTKAIVVVHTFGVAADAAPICELGVPVIEDCCQAFGRSTCIGQLGQMCVVSFHATKLLTTGEGGMLLSHDRNLLNRAREIVTGEHTGSSPRFRQPLSDLQAALGSSQLRRYDKFLARRRDLAEHYFAELADTAVGLPTHIRDRSLFFRFPLMVSGAFDEHRQAFDTCGVHVRRGVDTLLHRGLGLPPELFPGAERCFAGTLSLPLYPALTDEDTDRVVAATRARFGRR
jgi:UDP-4-amino-4-deoxy-L-arabinose-oxoglutarate aminotransferase